MYQVCKQNKRAKYNFGTKKILYPHDQFVTLANKDCKVNQIVNDMLPACLCGIVAHNYIRIICKI